MARALLIVDIQNDYFSGGANPLHEPEAAADAARRVLESFRAAGEPVIHVQHVWDAPDAPFMRPGTEGVEIRREVAPRDGEPVIQKHAPNAFLRTSLEQRQSDIQSSTQPAVTPPSGGATTGAAPSTSGAPASAPGGAGAGATPGPNQLFQISLEQLRRGSPGTARTGLLTLLQQYPTSDLVPDAQFYLGEAYHQEGNAAGADSAYAAVVSGYPTSPRAPTALYKRALGMEEKGNVVGARGLLNELVQRYPRSDEAALAKERLRTLK